MSASLPDAIGLYDPRNEHDACGVGFVVDVKGRKSHGVIEKGLQILLNLLHRGACGCEASTGDGAGVLVQMPDRFLRKATADLGFALPRASRSVHTPADGSDRKQKDQIGGNDEAWQAKDVPRNKSKGRGDEKKAEGGDKPAGAEKQAEGGEKPADQQAAGEQKGEEKAGETPKPPDAGAAEQAAAAGGEAPKPPDAGIADQAAGAAGGAAKPPDAGIAGQAAGAAAGATKAPDAGIADQAGAGTQIGASTIFTALWSWLRFPVALSLLTAQGGRRAVA